MIFRGPFQTYSSYASINLVTSPFLLKKISAMLMIILLLMNFFFTLLH